MAILEYLRTTNHDISETGSIFGKNHSVVYNIIRKRMEVNLKDRSRVPHHQPKKTSGLIEYKVVELKNKTQFGSERLSRYLKQHEDVVIPLAAIRHIVARNKNRLDYHVGSHRV